MPATFPRHRGDTVADRTERAVKSLPMPRRSVGHLAPLVAACLLGTAAADPVAERAPRVAEHDAVAGLRAWLAAPLGERPPLDEQAFGRTPLSAAEAERATRLLWQDHAAGIRRDRAAEMRAGEVRVGDARLRFETVRLPADDADEPAPRRALFFAMHGGGGVPAEINDAQWRNQVRLAAGYRPRHAIYVAPRAPVDAPAMWAVPAVDACFDRLIENLVVLEDVDPDQVYLMGYSAGGDGAFQLAPRLADRFAAAAALAGHPNDASPLGLRNLPFTIHVGEHDRAYGRNAVAVVWERTLAALRADDPDGYEHVVRVHEGKGHWLDLDDREAIPWMQGFRRRPLPTRVVWRQGHTLHSRFYWLAAAPDSVRDGDEVVAARTGQVIDVTIRRGTPRITVRLNDAMLDLDGDVSIRLAGKEVFAGRLPRTIATIARTLRERGDPAAVFSAEHALPAAPPDDAPAAAEPPAAAAPPTGDAAPAGASASAGDTPAAGAGPSPAATGAAAHPAPVAAALARAGDNRRPLEDLLARTPRSRLRGLEFLLEHMPARDLEAMPAALLEENVDSAYRALERAPWRDRIDEALFLNEILPYCVLTERRDAWRPALEARCRPLVDGIATPGAAAAALNKQLFPLVKVRYSRHRPLVDPSPAQALESGMASCTGLSILLVAACRSVAIPARFVGIPAWPGDTGNHSWVEVWDEGWHFTGAAEPAGDRLDEAWFTGRAAGALRDDPRHAIHAASFSRRPHRFPLPWPDDADVRPWSVNVTDRYARRGDPLPEGRVRVLLRVSVAPAGDRVAAEFEVRDASGAPLASGRTHDEQFDIHDDVPVVLPRDAELTVQFSWEGRTWTETIRPVRDAARHAFVVPPRDAPRP